MNVAFVPVNSTERFVGDLDDDDRRMYVTIALDAARERLRAYRLVAAGNRCFLSRRASLRAIRTVESTTLNTDADDLGVVCASATEHGRGDGGCEERGW